MYIYVCIYMYVYICIIIVCDVLCMIAYYLTLLVENGSHKQYATLTGLAAVQTL